MERPLHLFHLKDMTMAKVNTTPTDGMVSEAKKGLAWREEYGRGGTEVGIARARDIANRKSLSEKTVNRMVSFFARHEVDKKAEGFRPGEKGYPSNGRIAWALWGGDAGKSWANKKQAQFDKDRSHDDTATNVKPASEGNRMSEEIEEVIEEVELTEEVEATDEVELDEVDARELCADVEHRSLALEVSPINEETRKVQIAISSEAPVERSFGTEVLEHTEEAIDLSFLASGRAPVLLDHDPEKQVGVIESVDLDSSARRLRATVRFGKNGLAKEVFDDVVDGIRANISVGYSIDKLARQGDAYIAKRWRPVEASIVSIPADVTVGVGRSSETSQPTPPIIEIREEPKMSEVENTVDIEAVKAEAAKTAQRNASAIVELGARHNASDMAQRAISDGKSIEEFRGELLEKIGSERALENQDIGITKEETKRFSLMRAVNALANPHDRRAQEAAKFEFECSEAAAKQYGRTAQGVMLPAEVLKTWTRDLNSSDEASLFTDDYRGNDFIDVLRNQSSVMRAGARMLNGLSGDVKIPKKLTAASAAWISTEGGASSESEMTVGSVSMTPKTLGAHTDITRQLMIQSSMDVEALVRDDLAQALALAIDLAGLEGSGSSGQPTGILNTSGVNTVTSFAAANPTFAETVTLETAVANDNALSGNLAYIMPSAMYGALKTTEKASGTAQFVVEPGGTVNGYNALISNQGTAGNLYFGNFADLLIGMFGGLDITVDPYTNSTSGTVRIIALQSCDVAVRHAQSFAFGNDGA
jgi:HK97 family phage major capsid protein